MIGTTDDERLRTKAERLAVAGEIAPILRRAAASPRRVTLLDKDGKPTGVVTHIDVAEGLLRRASIEFDVQPGKARPIVDCDRCGCPFSRGTKPVNGRPSSRCPACRAPLVCTVDLVLSPADRVRLTEISQGITAPSTWARVRAWLCRAAKSATGDRLRISLTQQESAMLDALAQERADRLLSLGIEPEELGLRDGSVPRRIALKWSLLPPPPTSARLSDR